MIALRTAASLALCVVLAGAGGDEWPTLPATDGNSYSLPDFRGCRAIVLVFTGNECPIAADYNDRLNELAGRFRAGEVRFVAVNAAGGEGESIEDMKRLRAAPRFTYLKDERLELARRLGARVTPHVFVLDGDTLQVAYDGAIDDSPGDSARAGRRYLEDSIRAVLAGRPPSARSHTPRGCTIFYPSDAPQAR